MHLIGYLRAQSLQPLRDGDVKRYDGIRIGSQLQLDDDVICDVYLGRYPTRHLQPLRRYDDAFDVGTRSQHAHIVLQRDVYLGRLYIPLLQPLQLQLYVKPDVCAGSQLRQLYDDQSAHLYGDGYGDGGLHALQRHDVADDRGAGA